MTKTIRENCVGKKGEVQGECKKRVEHASEYAVELRKGAGARETCFLERKKTVFSDEAVGVNHQIKRDQEKERVSWRLGPHQGAQGRSKKGKEDSEPDTLKLKPHRGCFREGKRRSRSADFCCRRSLLQIHIWPRMTIVKRRQ